MQTSQIVDLERTGSCERYPGLSSTTQWLGLCHYDCGLVDKQKLVMERFGDGVK